MELLAKVAGLVLVADLSRRAVVTTARRRGKSNSDAVEMSPIPPEKQVASFTHANLGAPFEPPLEDGDRMHAPATAVDKKDADTPDNWVVRDPRILRLTGRHPLNCEPPMPVLLDYGFVTPPSVHIVRNHGAVPKLDWRTHKLVINGLVNKPITLSMDDLLKFPAHTVMCTVTCAGNRRKEENMVSERGGATRREPAGGRSHAKRS